MLFADFWAQSAKSIRKLQLRRPLISGLSCEALETRQLLSATNAVVEPVASAVALGVAGPYDPVGTWDVEVGPNQMGITETTVVVASKGKGFQATAELLGLDVTLKGKRDKDDPNLILFKGKVKDPEFKKVKIAIDTTLTSDTTFTADLILTNKTFGSLEVDATGEKQVPMSSGVPTGSELFDPVGSWEVFVGSNPLGLTSGAVDVTAKGKKGKVFTATGHLNDVEFSVTGKRQKDDPNLIFFKGAVKLPEIGKTQVFLDAELSSSSMFDGVFAAVNKKNEIGFETSAQGIKLG